MPVNKANDLFMIAFILLCGSFIFSFGTELAEADPLITQNINAISWNYLPVVRAQQSGIEKHIVLQEKILRAL